MGLLLHFRLHFFSFLVSKVLFLVFEPMAVFTECIELRALTLIGKKIPRIQSKSISTYASIHHTSCYQPSIRTNIASKVPIVLSLGSVVVAAGRDCRSPPHRLASKLAAPHIADRMPIAIETSQASKHPFNGFSRKASVIMERIGAI